MSDYIISLLCVAIFTGIITALIGAGPFYSSLKALCGLTVLLTVTTMLSPVLSSITDIVSKIPEIDELPESNVTDETVVHETAKYISIYTKDFICTRFGADKNILSVSTTLSTDENGNISIKSVTVNFTAKTDLNLQEISSVISETLMCECIVLSP